MRTVRLVAAAGATVLMMAVLSAAGASALPATGSDWTQPRFDAGHAGYNPLETQIKAKYVGLLHRVFFFEGNFVAPPIEIAGLLDVPYRGRLDALDPNTGDVVWSRRFKEGLSAGVAGMGTSVYVPTSSALYELDADTGKLLSSWPDMPSTGAPVVTDDAVYVHTTTQLVAIDRQTHEDLWTHPTTVEATPSVAGGLVFERKDGSHLVALSATTGNRVWGPVSFGGDPAVSDGMVFGIWPAQLTALDAATGTLLWSAPAGGRGVPAVANGSVYVTRGVPSAVESFDEATGSPQWSSQLPGKQQYDETDITVVNDVVFASCTRGVQVLNTNGKPLRLLYSGAYWNEVSGAATVVNGHVYFFATGKRFPFAAYAIWRRCELPASSGTQVLHDERAGAADPVPHGPADGQPAVGRRAGRAPTVLDRALAVRLRDVDAVCVRLAVEVLVSLHVEARPHLFDVEHGAATASAEVAVGRRDLVAAVDRHQLRRGAGGRHPQGDADEHRRRDQSRHERCPRSSHHRALLRRLRAA